MEKNTNPAGGVIARLEEDECDEAGMFMGTARVVPMVVVAPIIERLEARIAALEAERAEREGQKPVRGAFMNKDGGVTLCQNGKEHCSFGFLSMLYAAAPITSPVRLTDKQIAESHANEIMNCLQDPCDKSESVMPMPHDVNRFVRAIETAVLRANGFNIDHPEHALELVGLRGCNSRHGGAREPDPCIYRMRTTDPGCTGCAERDEDQAAEAGG